MLSPKVHPSISADEPLLLVKVMDSLVVGVATAEDMYTVIGVELKDVVGTVVVVSACMSSSLEQENNNTTTTEANILFITLIFPLSYIIRDKKTYVFILYYLVNLVRIYT